MIKNLNILNIKINSFHLKDQIKNFVSKKITQGVAKIKLGLTNKIYLGNLNTRRDWGYAPDYVEEIFEDKDWVTYTQSQFKEIFISDSLRIVPPWESNSEFSGQSIIIQPGSGFGTGTHPTTQLCLRWLENNLKENNTVLDYGCGSGVLSIAAKVLGAGFVEGVEIDPKAILNAEQNNELNNLMIPYHHPDSFESNEKYDIVIANILADILIRLAPTLGPFIGHKLVLSGILENQAKDVIQSYSEWVSLSVQAEMGGWILLLSN